MWQVLVYGWVQNFKIISCNMNMAYPHCEPYYTSAQLRAPHVLPALSLVLATL